MRIVLIESSCLCFTHARVYLPTLQGCLFRPATINFCFRLLFCRLQSFVKKVSRNFLGANLPRLSTKLGKRKPEKGNVEDMTVEERLAMLNTTNENAKVPHTFFRVADPDPDWIRIQSGQWIRIQEGKNDPQKLKKFVKVHVLKCWTASFES